MKPLKSIKSNHGIPDQVIPFYLLTDEQGLIHAVSESLLQFTERKRQSLIGSSVSSLLTLGEGKKFNAFIQNRTTEEPDQQCSIFLKGKKRTNKIFLRLKKRRPGTNLIEWTCLADVIPVSLLNAQNEDRPWYLRFFENAAEPVFIYNAIDLSVIFINQAADKLYGYTGRELMDCFLYDTNPSSYRTSEAFFLEPGSYSLYSKNGHQVFVQVFTSPIEINDQPHCLVFANLHSQERRNPPQTGKKINTKIPPPDELEMIVSSMDDVVFVYDNEGLFIKIWCRNESMLQLMPQQFLGKSMQEAFRALPDFVAPFIEDFETALEKKEICTRDFPVQAGGISKWLNSKITPLYYADGKPKGFTQRITDITEQKKVEISIADKNAELKEGYRELQFFVESLRATEERYSTFINHSTEAIWRFEPGTQINISMKPAEIIEEFMKHAYLAECNDQMAKYYGFNSASEIEGMPLSKLLPVEDSRNLQFLEAFISNGFKLDNAESFELDKDGNKKHFVNNLIGIVQDGQLIRIWGTQRDITAQRVAEEKIRYQARVLQDISDVIISTDLNFNIIAWNAAAEAVYGFTENEAISKPIRSIIDHVYTTCTRGEALAALDKNDKWEGEAYFDRKDGKRIYLSMRLTYVKDDTGQRIGFAGIHQDITEKRRAEEALRISEQKYRSVVNALGEGILMIDRRGVIIACNHSVEKIMGVSKEKIIERKAAGEARNLIYEDGSFYKPEDQPSAITLRTGKPLKNVVMGVIKGDESICWISINTEPIYYTDQRESPDAVVASIVDITEKKKAELILLNREQQLREYSERISSILDSITDGFLAVDKDFHIVLWNHVIEKATGKKASEVIGKTIAMVFPEILGTALYESYLNAIEKKIPVTFESFSAPFNLWYESSVYPSSQGLFIYLRDITERKTQENLLALEKEVLEINAQPAASLKNTVDYFLEGIELIYPGMWCSVLTLDEQSKKIKHLSAPSLPVTFSTAIDGTLIGPTAGSSGAAMFSKKRVISFNTSEDPVCKDLLPIYTLFGIKACWAFPILDAQGEVIATISAYYKYSKNPDQKALQVLERISNLLRIIMVNKTSEETIRQSNERYLLISKATNDAIWDWDIITNRLYWGEGFYTLFRYPPGVVDNSFQFWEDRIHPDDKQRVTEGLGQFLTDGTSTSWSDEYWFRKPDDTYVLVYDRGFLIYNQEGKVNRMVGSMQDITEKREMEKQLLKQQLNRQQLIAQAVVDAQEKERGDIGKELHDNVNQILSTARLYLDLARSDEKERLNLIKRSTENIFDAINEIRNISRSLVPGSIGDLGIVESINDLVESIKATKKLHVEFYYEGQVDKLLDEKQKLMLFRIIQEQVNNVLKHANARNLVIEFFVDDDVIDLTISDDGQGFEPGNTKNKKGVGLYNITSRTELFNGKVNIVASPGNGCKMNINVPISNLKP